MDASVKTSVAPGLSGRYASALFDLAVDGGHLDAVSASVASLGEALAASADLRTLTTSPLIDRKTAGAGIAGVAESLGLDTLTRNFLGVLAQGRRLALLPQIVRDFSALLAARKGEITARVTAAHKLTAAQQKALAAKLKAGLGRDVALDITVDPAILGGLVVRVGSRMIDSSLKTRLDSLGQALKG
ncbi:F0F1 ATP synthase subunit delta [Sandarakinorhabdus sp.]|uniref:F0F1 ATP synthase subunit delta n=1 Tax=Sandarakinorhabdus sp. TaxID=1916663 RepID=UPI00286E013F|nr:F0F1 ATP synthase subunit delta [Sandarakinorhabdus sp.]